MGRIEATAKIETPNPGQQVSSYPPTPQILQSPYMGGPWDSGLFDCHLDQTNGNFINFTTLCFCFSFLKHENSIDQECKQFDNSIFITWFCSCDDSSFSLCHIWTNS